MRNSDGTTGTYGGRITWPVTGEYHRRQVASLAQQHLARAHPPQRATERYGDLTVRLIGPCHQHCILGRRPGLAGPGHMGQRPFVLALVVRRERGEFGRSHLGRGL